jgi:hypothetical protein
MPPLLYRYCSSAIPPTTKDIEKGAIKSTCIVITGSFLGLSQLLLIATFIEQIPNRLIKLGFTLKAVNRQALLCFDKLALSAEKNENKPFLSRSSEAEMKSFGITQNEFMKNK